MQPDYAAFLDLLSELATTTVLIAQYGPIGQLPSKFGGIDGNVSLSVFTDTGALKTVTVGAKPASASTVTQPIDLAQGLLASRSAEKEAEEQQENDAELKALLPGEDDQ